MSEQVVTVRYHKGEWFVRTSPPILNYWCRLRGATRARGDSTEGIFARNPRFGHDLLRRFAAGWMVFLASVWFDKRGPVVASEFKADEPWRLVVAKPGPAPIFFEDR